jgi:D-glycero-D-manno-heptose 1,7-bisphosphate phosphatase
MKRAVFLDRDGTINAMVYNPDFGLVDSPQNPGEFRLLPGAGEAIRAIHDAGFLTVVVSNQPGVAKGKCTPALLEAITEKMRQGLAEDGARLDAVYYCLHHPEAALPDYRAVCDCRKPKPGLLLRAAQELGIDLNASFLVGDGITDLLAGMQAGVTTVFVSSRKCYICDDLERQGAEPEFTVPDLLGAARLISSIAAPGSSTRPMGASVALGRAGRAGPGAEEAVPRDDE